MPELERLTGAKRLLGIWNFNACNHVRLVTFITWFYHEIYYTISTEENYMATIRKTLTAIAAVISCVLIFACATSSDAGKQVTYMSKAMQVEAGGDYVKAIAYCAMAQSVGELTREQVEVEYTRIASVVGADKFKKDLDDASTYCGEQSRKLHDLVLGGTLSRKEQQKASGESMHWAAARLNLTMRSIK